MSENLKLFAIGYNRFGHIDFEGFIVTDAPDQSNVMQWIRFWAKRFAERRGTKHMIFIFSALGPRRGIARYPWRFLQTQVVDLIHFCRVMLRRLSLHLAQWCGGAVVTIDDGDHMGVAPADRYQLRASVVYFKREGFANPWMNLVTSEGSKSHPGVFILHGWLRESSLRLIKKMRTLSLGVRVEDTIKEVDFSIKTTDVFLAVESRHLPSRELAISIARYLREKDFRVFIPDGRMDFESYLTAIRTSWLVISPSGNGWDCYRHYEAAANGALPVMDYPYIRAHRAFIHGENCVYLGTDETGESLAKLLRDKEALRTMIESAHAQAHAHHTDLALGRHVITEIRASIENAKYPQS